MQIPDVTTWLQMSLEKKVLLFISCTLACVTDLMHETIWGGGGGPET